MVPALLFVLWYWQRHKIPLLKALDIIAIALMVGLSMGRIGCFLNGCCFGKPTESCCAVQFPYESYAYQSQIRPNVERGRNEPHLELPMEYYVYDMIEGRSIYQLKPFDSLTPEQQEAVTHGEYRCLPVYPTQLFASAGAHADRRTSLWRVVDQPTAPMDRAGLLPGDGLVWGDEVYSGVPARRQPL